MGAPGQQRHAHVCQRRAGKHAPVALFQNVGADEILPILCQHIGMAFTVKRYAASRRARRKAQVYLGIMAQRLEMAAAHYGVCDGFPVQHAAGAERYLCAVSLPQHGLQYLQLDLSHHLNVHTLQLFAEFHAQQRLLVLHLTQQLQQAAGRKLRPCQYLGGKQRPQCGRHTRPGIRPHNIPGHHPAQTGGGAQRARPRFGQRRAFSAAVCPQPVHLVIRSPALFRAGHILFGAQTPCQHLQKHDAAAVFLMTHLVHTGAEKRVSGLFLRCGAERRQYVQQRVNACAVQSRAHHCRTNKPRPHQCGAALPGGLRVIAADKIILHQRFVPRGQLLRQGLSNVRRAEIRPARQHIRPQACTYRRQRSGSISGGQVRLVQKKHHGHVVLPQQPPDGLRMGLYALHTAYHQYRAVHGPDAALHLAAEIRVARGVDQAERKPAGRKRRFVGKYRDAAAALDDVMVQTGVAAVHAPGAPQRAAPVQKLLRKRRLARVHMSENAHDSFHKTAPFRGKYILL